MLFGRKHGVDFTGRGPVCADERFCVCSFTVDYKLALDKSPAQVP
jgi:hypothetical protein